MPMRLQLQHSTPLIKPKVCRSGVWPLAMPLALLD